MRALLTVQKVSACMNAADHLRKERRVSGAHENDERVNVLVELYPKNGRKNAVLPYKISIYGKELKAR